MQPTFNDQIRRLREGAPAERIFPCPYCGGRARIDAGLQTKPQRVKWWVLCRCYDCGRSESFNGVTPWPTIEELTKPFVLPFSENETLLAVRRLLSAGHTIPAIKLYRDKFGVSLAEAHIAVEAMRGEKKGNVCQPG